jgi:hypothetical protein
MPQLTFSFIFTVSFYSVHAIRMGPSLTSPISRFDSYRKFLYLTYYASLFIPVTRPPDDASRKGPRPQRSPPTPPSQPIGWQRARQPDDADHRQVHFSTDQAHGHRSTHDHQRDTDADDAEQRRRREELGIGNPKGREPFGRDSQAGKVRPSSKIAPTAENIPARTNTMNLMRLVGKPAKLAPCWLDQHSRRRQSASYR